MGLFSNKNKRDRALDDSGRFYSKDDDAAIGERARSKRASSAGASAGAGTRRTANDPMLPEKKRARRRLVGAIALALAAAVGLPMMLDSGPKPLAGDIAIQIPSKDKAAPLPVPTAQGDGGAASATAATAPAPAAHGKSVAAADSVDQGEEVIAAPPAPKAAPHKPESKAESKAEPKPEPKPVAAVELPRAEHKEPKPERKDPPKPEHAKAETRLADKAEKARESDRPHESEKPVKPKLEDKPAKPHEDARALAILEGKGAEARSEAAASQKSVIQVAAMSSADKAAEVQAKLRAAGLSSYTEKAANGLIRVKVSFAKDDADSVRAKLAKLGL